MSIRQIKQDRFEWKLYRNALFAAALTTGAYCSVGLIIALIVLIFSRVGGLLVVGRSFPGSESLWLLFLVIFLGFSALAMPGPIFITFFGGLLTFALACLVPAALRFRIAKRPRAEIKTLVLLFGLTLSAYCAVEFLGVFLARPYHNESNPFFLFGADEMPFFFYIWGICTLLRLYLLWNSHRAIIEYYNPTAQGRLVD